jgi:hypothetical protein
MILVGCEFESFGEFVTVSVSAPVNAVQHVRDVWTLIRQVRFDRYWESNVFKIETSRTHRSKNVQAVSWSA